MANTRAIRAGKAFVEIYAEDSKLQRTLKKSANRVHDFAKDVRKVGLSMTAIGGMIAAPLAIATKVFTSFDDQMRKVGAKTGAVGAEFDMLTDKAKLLGRTTSFTATQVGQAMEELGKAGFDPKQIDAATASILNLARATDIELGEAATIASGVMNTFQLNASDMAKIADTLTVAVNNSAMNMDDLKEAMVNAGPIASQYGMTMEETVVAIGQLANFTIKGSKAGTAIKKMMTQIADPKIRKEIEAMGVQLRDTATKEMLPIPKILQNMGNKLKALSKMERIDFVKKVFGERAIAGALAMATGNFDKLSDAMEKSHGVAAKTAADMDAGIGGAFRRLWSAIEGIGIAVGDSIGSIVSAAADIFTAVLGPLTEWIEKNEWLGKTLVIISATLITIGGTLFIVSSGMFLYAKAAAALAIGLGGVKTVMMWMMAHPLILGLVAAASVAVGLMNSMSKIKQSMEQLNEKTQEWLELLKKGEEAASSGDSAIIKKTKEELIKKRDELRNKYAEERDALKPTLARPGDLVSGIFDAYTGNISVRFAKQKNLLIKIAGIEQKIEKLRKKGAVAEAVGLRSDRGGERAESFAKTISGDSQIKEEAKRKYIEAWDSYFKNFDELGKEESQDIFNRKLSAIRNESTRKTKQKIDEAGKEIDIAVSYFTGLWGEIKKDFVEMRKQDTEATILVRQKSFEKDQGVAAWKEVLRWNTDMLKGGGKDIPRAAAYYEKRFGSDIPEYLQQRTETRRADFDANQKKIWANVTGLGNKFKDAFGPVVKDVIDVGGDIGGGAIDAVKKLFTVGDGVDKAMRNVFSRSTFSGRLAEQQLGSVSRATAEDKTADNTGKIADGIADLNDKIDKNKLTFVSTQ